MKCYVNYYHKGTFKDQLVYKEQEVNVDLDLAHLKKLNAPIKLKIEKDGNQYLVTGSYYIPVDAFSSQKEPVKSKNFSKFTSKHQHPRRNPPLHSERQIRIKRR